MFRPFAVLAALSVALLAPAAACAQPTPVHRDIDLAPYGKIVLGEPFTADSIATRHPEGFYALRPGTFAGAEAVDVIVVDDLVAAIRFTYAPVAADYETYVANATEALGPPLRGTREVDGGGRMDCVAWRDARTVLEICLTTWSDRVELASMMVDRRLMEPRR
jgi:hypothetical protein